MSKVNNNVIVRCKKICKDFDGVEALKDVDFDLKKGEIHGLVGENGAGKTTLINILCGAIKNDSGEIEINLKKYDCININIAKINGINIIPQHVSLIYGLTIAENLFLNNWTKNRLGFINWSKLNKIAAKILKKVELNLNPKQKVEGLSYINQQIITITKVFFVENTRILILDEPTAPLTYKEIVDLFRFIELLKKKGVSFIYITHHMDEIFKICDRVTVLRDGRSVLTEEVNKLTMRDLTNNMIGKGIDIFSRKNIKVNRLVPVLEVKNLKRKPILKDICFKLYKGEVLGIAGLKGSGRTEIARSICGLDKFDDGNIILNGKIIKIKNVGDVLNLGIGYLTEDRIKWGLIETCTVKENISISILNKLINKIGLIKVGTEKKIAKDFVRDLDIKTATINQPILDLSGGNQQKVMVSRLLAANLNIFFFDDPTFGIDIKTKMQIYNIINDITSEDKSVVIISSEITELINVCDRVIVIQNGSVKYNINTDQIDENVLKNLIEGKNNAN